jgi:antitoxin (DNA-binding transcriptional repressor) of toxin-antitoxin stability system
MKKITIRQARQSLTHLDQLLADEGEVVITRRGQPIARLARIGRKRPIPSHRDLREAMRPMRRGSEEMIRQDRDAR